ncbi:location of vulva defective 1-like isoform X1 [Halichondria panicea]|uniref:location of vulva defective 1-like isoform X1 n=1 Tax=Halichondria panicea TaxID=6063 RepID=UPI00312B4B15
MVGHRFLVVCCVLVLTIYELGGATGSIDYTLDPVTKPKKDEKTDVSIHFVLTVPTKLFNEESVSMVFTVEPLNHPPLNILISDIIVPESSVSVETKDGFTMYSGEFEVQVSVTADTDGVIGNLRATLSCDHPILCKDEDKTVVKTKVIVQETKTLHVTATPSYDVSQTSPTANVTITLSKDLATPDELTLSVSLINEDPQGDDYSSERVPVPKAESSFPVVFTNIQWGDYQLTIGCGNNSVCSALSQWIDFPEPVSVAAHPSLPEIGATIFDLKKTVADYNTIKDDDKNLQEKVASLSSHSDYLTDMVSVLIVEIAELKALHNVTDDPSPTTTLTPVIITETAEATISTTETTTTTEPITTPTTTTSISDDNSTTTSVGGASDAGGAGDAPSQTTRYMEFAVGGLIAALVCGLLGYLLYHYRTKVKEWICSKKVVVSNLPIARKLRRNAGSRYSKLPRTMQEALHQD